MGLSVALEVFILDLKVRISGLEKTFWERRHFRLNRAPFV